MGTPFTEDCNPPVSLNVCPLVSLNKLPTLQHRSEASLLLNMSHQPKVSESVVISSNL